jgi:hypothetical protein
MFPYNETKYNLMLELSFQILSLKYTPTNLLKEKMASFIFSKKKFNI